jgi:prepilin-type N-terminal cleavage/methylation domain-containing protein
MESMKILLEGRIARRGVSMIECMIALAVAGLGLGTLMAVNSYQFRSLRLTHDATSATQALQERIEQMRIANWRQLTDPDFLKDSYFAAAPKTAANIDGLEERITVSPYPPTSGGSSLVVERTPGHSPRIVSQGSGIETSRLARVNLTMEWDGVDGRRHVRDSTVVLSNGGISRQNLPAFGSPASGTPTTTTPTTTTTTPTTTTTTPTTTTTTPTTTTTTPTTTTTTPTTGNTKGNGRGTIGGVSGKK